MRTGSDARVRGLEVDDGDWLSRGFLALGGLLGRWHRHEVLGLDRLEAVLARGRRVVLVGNHALSVVDPLLFVSAVKARCGVVPRFIGHSAWFRTPGLREIVRRYHVIEARRPDETARALREDGILMLFPGAVREAAVRDYHGEPYRLKWEGRVGFLELALQHDAEVMFVAAVGNDEAYYQSRLPVPDALLRYMANGESARYRGARVTFGLLGPHPLPGVFPLPVRMTHVLSAPVDLGDRDLARRDRSALSSLHERVTRECQAALDAAIAGREERSDLPDRVVRGAEQLLHELGL